jgi:hypothetical protein
MNGTNINPAWLIAGLGFLPVVAGAAPEDAWRPLVVTPSTVLPVSDPAALAAAGSAAAAARRLSAKYSRQIGSTLSGSARNCWYFSSTNQSFGPNSGTVADDTVASACSVLVIAGLLGRWGEGWGLRTPSRLDLCGRGSVVAGVGSARIRRPTTRREQRIAGQRAGFGGSPTAGDFREATACRVLSRRRH